MAKKRTKKRTPKKGPIDWAGPFLTRLSETGNVSAACSHAKVARQRAYERKAAEHEFGALWAQALDVAIDALELEARRRALEGTERPVFHQGEECGRVREFSDTLMIFLLKAHRPEKYRENVKHELTGPGGGNIGHTVTVVVKRDRSFFGRDPTAGTPAASGADPGKPGPV